MIEKKYCCYICESDYARKKKKGKPVAEYLF